MNRHLLRLSGILAIALALEPLSAQSSPSPATAASGLATVDGIVSDTSLAPLHGAFISIVGTPLRVGTGANGRFRITNLRAGHYLVIVKRVGYRPVSGVIDVQPADTLRVAYTLEPATATLPTVTVSEKPFSARMGD